MFFIHFLCYQSLSVFTTINILTNYVLAHNFFLIILINILYKIYNIYDIQYMYYNTYISYIFLSAFNIQFLHTQVQHSIYNILL